METSSAGEPRAAPIATDRPAGSPMRARAWNPEVVGAVFLGGSLAILAAGIALNFFLTDGHWDVRRNEVASAFGDGPTYLTDNVYDVVTLSLLVAALAALGVGFLAAYNPRHRSPWFLVAAIGGLGLIAASQAALVADEQLALVAGVVLVLFAFCWGFAGLIGPGDRMHGARATGFVLFGAYWATQVMRLYHAEEGDFVNAAFAGVAVLFFNYFAYHELLSIQRREDPRALHWLSGAAFLTTGVYVATHKLQVVSEWLIVRVAEQTTWLLQFFDQGVERGGGVPEGSMILYPQTDPNLVFPIQIILACTAIQSIMIFVGGIFALRPPMMGDGLSGRANLYQRLRPTYESRRFFALMLTVPLIYALNLLRNVLIISLSANGNPPFFNGNAAATEFICNFTTQGGCGPAEAAFWFSHNIIGKGGSLVALVIIAFMVFQILPELYDSIVGLLDLKDRQGPLEKFFGIRPRGGTGGTKWSPATAPSAPVSDLPPAPDRLEAAP